MDVRDKLLTENPWKLMISLSLPAILGQLIVGLYAFVDSIYVGQMVGTDAMSAVSAASPFVLKSAFRMPYGRCFRFGQM